jgi:hypothetical protein
VQPYQGGGEARHVVRDGAQLALQLAHLRAPVVQQALVTLDVLAPPVHVQDVAVQVEFEKAKGLKPGFHLIGSRIERNQALSSYWIQLVQPHQELVLGPLLHVLGVAAQVVTYLKANLETRKSHSGSRHQGLKPGAFKLEEEGPQFGMSRIQ